jgi:hypothetical protein
VGIARILAGFSRLGLIRGNDGGTSEPRASFRHTAGQGREARQGGWRDLARGEVD